MTPAQHLARKLKTFDNFERGDIGRYLGIPPDMVRRAANGASGQPTRAAYHVRLCAWLGIDPVTGEARTARRLVVFHAASFAAACRMRRYERAASLRDIGKLAKVSASAVTRAEHGDPRSFANVLKLTRALDLHLDNYIVPDVSRGTVTGNSEAA